MKFCGKRVLHIVLCSFVVVLLALSAAFMLFPVNFACATQEFSLPNDYDAFYQSFMRMEGDNSQNNEIATISAVSNSKDEINRLIVYSHDYVPSHGAKWEARFREWNFFQYSTHQDAEDAYDFLINLNYDVAFDAYVNVNYTSTSEDVQTFDTSTHIYKTWADPYVHYDNFISRQLNGSIDDVYVFVFDTGVNKDHILLNGRIDGEDAKSFVGYTPKTVFGGEETYAYYDDHYVTDDYGGVSYGHGTHVSGTIAELTKSNVKIVPYKVLNSSGSGSVSGIISAIMSLTEYKSMYPSRKIVANMSLGVDYSDTTIDPVYSDLNKAVKKGSEAGIPFVVSAGNESQDTKFVSPASCDEAIVVSALKRGGSLDNGLVFESSYSNYGKHVDFAAPGTGISSASNINNSGYHTLSGTSMAAPHVTACYALLFSCPEYQTVENATQTLIESCVDLGRSGRDDYYGYGCINLRDIGKLFDDNQVQFSSQDDTGAQSARFELSFGQNDCKIYYTFSEVSNFDGSDIWNVYDNPVEIDQTQKVTAVATYTTENGQFVETRLASKTYYVNNYDLISNYAFDRDLYNSAIITHYYGTELTTLNLPKSYQVRQNGVVSTVNVVMIGEFAFGSESIVETLNLSDSIYSIEADAFNGAKNIREITGNNVRYIRENAFNGCENLQKISFTSSSLTSIASHAFNDCKNLTSIGNSFKNVRSVGTYAFAGCKNLVFFEDTFLNVESVGAHAFKDSKLNLLTLPKVSSIGAEAFLNAEISELLIGPNLTNFKIEYQTSVDKFFGYSELVNCNEFVDINLRVLQPAEEFTKYLQKGSTLNFDVEIVGYNVKIAGGVVSEIEKADKSNNYTFKCHFSFDGQQPLTSKIYFCDGFSNYVDIFGNEISSMQEAKSLQVNVVDSQTKKHTFKYVGDNFRLKINGVFLSERQMTFYEGDNSRPFEYVIEIVPDEGWLVDRVSISTNPNLQSIDKKIITLTNVTQDVTLSISTAMADGYKLTFNHSGGEVFVGDSKIGGTYSVERGGELKFTVKENVGYKLIGVSVDGEPLIAQNGVYTISNILKEMTIDVLFEEIFHTVQVQSGVGGMFSYYPATGENIGHGDSRTYRISPSDGYVVDFVTVNGKPVQLKDNMFTVENVTEDIVIVISFKKQNRGFLSGDTVLLDYFIIFIILLLVFALAKLAVFLIRKRKPDLRKY